MKIINRWNECYEGVHTQTNPQEFQRLFCNNCLNTTCELSKGSKLSWTQRMQTQVEDLLNNPKFADVRDPEFQQIRNMDFRDMLHQELVTRIGNTRGDWKIPSAMEISTEASKVLSKLDPNRDTPTDLLQENFISEPQQEPEYIVRSLSIKGSNNAVYLVSYVENIWHCTCPSFTFNTASGLVCKHILKVKGVSTPEEPQKTVQAVLQRPPPILKQPHMNTHIPTQGITIGNTPIQESEPKQEDWTVPEVPKQSGKLKSGVRFSFKK